MKNSIYYPIIILFMMTLSLAGCKKQVDAEYISQCAGVSGSTMEARNANCWQCCVNNGWERGTYWEDLGVAVPGCECENDK